MRPLMRNALLAVGIVAILLLALGALPGYLGAGDYYYLEATDSDDDGTALDAEELGEQRYPYLTAALAADDGRSDGYQRAFGGFKDAFTHSPFDEFDSFQQLEPEAVRDDGDRVIIEVEGERYSVEIVTEPEGQ